MKKKIAIMILTLSMTFSLASCGSEELANISTSDVANVVQSVEDAIESASQESESAVDETEEEPESESESESESEESESQAEEQESSEAPLEETTEAEAASEEAAESSEESPAEPETPTYTFSDKSGVKYAKANVNVRDVPSKEGSKVGSLSTNDKVEFTGICNETGWYRFTMNGKDAYVSGNYLVNEKVAVQAPTPAPVDNSGTQVANNNGNGSDTQGVDNSGSGNCSDSTPAPANNGNSTASAPVDTNSSASAPEGGNTQVAGNGESQENSEPNYGNLTGKDASGTYDRYVDDAGNVTYVDDNGEVKQEISADQIGGGDGFVWENTAEDEIRHQQTQDAIDKRNNE